MSVIPSLHYQQIRFKGNNQSDRESSFLPYLSAVAQMYGILAMHKPSRAGCALPSVDNIMKLTYSWG